MDVEPYPENIAKGGMFELFDKLKSIIEAVDPDNIPTWVRRYYRKLSVRCLLEKDFYSHHQRSSKRFESDYILISKETLFKPYVSNYTLRTLKPYIRVDRDTEPPRLRLLSDICKSKGRQYQRHPILYKYVEKRHIKAINSLCELHFWPGIDLSEALECPEFSVVAEYKRIVIGFGFLIPDVSFVEAYVSFLFTLPGWRNSGLAKYMLYHLTQTCRNKDITLHVSVSNTQALKLYQMFSFKPQEFIRHFYEQFMPLSSKECRHAFFLRLFR